MMQRASVILRHNKLRILPTRHGVYCGFLLLAGFAMGYQTQNNFILLAVMFLAVAYIFTLFVTVRNMQGLNIEMEVRPHYFADMPQMVTVKMVRLRGAYNLDAAMGDAQQSFSLIESNHDGGMACFQMAIGRGERGVYRVPRLKIETVFPFGLARCWIWTQLPLEIVVCPAPLRATLSEYRRISQHGNQDVNDGDELRDYQPGDRLAQIDWKRYAMSQRLMVRESVLASGGALLLMPPSGMAREAALEWLCGGLQLAQNATLSAHMWLDDKNYVVRHVAQFEEAYHALALA